MIEYKKNTWNNINRDVENEDTRGRNTDGKEDGEKRALKCQGVPFPRAGQHKFMTEEMKKKRKSALIVTRPSSAERKINKLRVRAATRLLKVSKRWCWCHRQHASRRSDIDFSNCKSWSSSLLSCSSHRLSAILLRIDFH